MTIAQHFSAGFRRAPQPLSPVGTAERGAAFGSAVPTGLDMVDTHDYPALKCWAIVTPSLPGRGQDCVASVGASSNGPAVISCGQPADRMILMPPKGHIDAGPTAHRVVIRPQGRDRAL